MPFTLAHPFVVVPLARATRQRLITSALVIGSMSPDFEYLLRGEAEGQLGHTPAGLVLFSLPLGLAVLAVFQYLVKEPVLRLLPSRFDARTSAISAPLALGSWGMAARAAISVFLGAVSHVVLDAFTHAEGFVVRALPLLRTAFAEAGEFEVSAFTVLQHGGSVVGLALLAAWAWQWLSSAPRAGGREQVHVLPDRSRAAIVAALAAITVAASVASGRDAARDLTGLAALRAFAVQASVTWMSAAALAITLYSAAYRFARRRGRRSEPRHLVGSRRAAAD